MPSATDIMSDAEGLADTGDRNLQEMVHSMKEFKGSSERTSKIVRVVDEIEFQANILALNAALEGAGAEEAGVSFAAADEVRRLVLIAGTIGQTTSGSGGGPHGAAQAEAGRAPRSGLLRGACRAGSGDRT